MSKLDNLPEFLIDMADALRAATETTDKIPAENFSSVVASIKRGGYNIEQVILDDYACELHITDADYVPGYVLTLVKSGSNSDGITILNGASAEYPEGQEISINAEKNDMGRLTQFDGWYEGDALISSDLSFTYTMPNRDVTLTAKTSLSQMFG